MHLLNLDMCPINKVVTVHSFLPITEDLKHALNNIGIYEGKKIIVKANKYQNQLIFIIINGVEYVIRTREANSILVYEAQDSKK